MREWWNGFMSRSPDLRHADSRPTLDLPGDYVALRPAAGVGMVTMLPGTKIIGANDTFLEGNRLRRKVAIFRA